MPANVERRNPRNVFAELHFRLRRIEFAPDKIVIAIDRVRENVVQVTFRLAAADVEAARRVVNVISGERGAP